MINWVKFWSLALIWGSSFLLIKVGVEELGALPLVSIRLGGAALLFLMYVIATKRKFPTKPSERTTLLVVGVFNTAVPFFLISWGETHINSGLATVLNSTVPLFTLLISHFAVHDEKLNHSKVMGLVIGFVGVIIVTSGNLQGDTGSLLGQLAVLVASLSYGIAITLIRKNLRQVDPYTSAAYSTIIGGVIIVTITLLTTSIPTDASAKALGAGVFLAIVNTFIAYFLSYGLIAVWGARASLVTYAMPPIGLTLGYLVLDEKIGWQLLFGGILIISGIIIAKVQPKWRWLRLRAVPEATPK